MEMPLLCKREWIRIFSILHVLVTVHKAFSKVRS